MNFLRKNHEHESSKRIAVSKTIKILMLCFITTAGFSQKKLNKTSQSIKVNSDVVVDLNTNYVEIEVDTWSKDEVEVEAYIESSKLSEEELKEALKSWNLNVDASMDEVVISSEGAGRFPGLFVANGSSDYNDILQELELNLADMPEIPEVIVLPDMSRLGNFPELPEMPEMPEFPELPELPEGIKSISFDYDRYQEEGEKYLEEWSKKYEKEGGKELQERMEAWAKRFAESGYQEKMKKWGEEYGKRFEGKWAKDMEKWGEEFGEKFGKDMEKWGEEFGEKFGEEWAEKMEAWGERFGRQMERRAEAMERRAEAMEKRAEVRAKSEVRRKEARAKREKMLAERESLFAKRLERGANSKVKRVIKIRMPKKAKLKLNVRHGELKVGSVLHNAQGKMSHSSLLAQSIDGSNTSINMAYSNVLINDWKNGTLSLKYVDDALLKNVQSLTLNSNSSNINIDYLSGNNIIDGSFGELTIHNIADAFNNLNIILENSEALVNLPNVDYNLMFRGERSKFNNEYTTSKTVNGNSGKSIIVNAKFSSLTTN
ncbi:MAG: hypothetical protein ED556_05375 [Winogradskyella sp.]|uniref:hypothetical protein n=1 Tax=Winogradskyella sp. TaxID=1883156 RepID=UPI000F3F1ACC|nr:hypothetical protein [Winogradskyella sp.]RNC86855.1 MAG: hypothetical protein ED556_05375 [Winogradskyella sp.]